MRYSVIVIPRYDAESSGCNQRHFTPLMFSGFRVVARNDDYRAPHLNFIYTIILLYFSSNRTADDPPFAMRFSTLSRMKAPQWGCRLP